MESFRAAHQRYAAIRTWAYEEGLREALAIAASGAIGHGRARRLLGGRVRLTGLDLPAIAAWETMWRDRPHWTGAGGWAWDRLARRFGRRPQCFHLAVWSGDQLCGLAAGRVSRRTRVGARNLVSVHFMESAPDREHPLRGWIVPLVLQCAAAYGAMLGASRLVLREPLPGVLPLYRKLGFTVAHPAPHRVDCWKRI